MPRELGFLRPPGVDERFPRPDASTVRQMDADRLPDPPSAGVEVRRSGRRNRTVTAYRDGERTVVLIPEHFDAAAEAEWVERMQSRLRRQERRRRPGEDELLQRAREISERYLDGRA